MMLMFVAVVQAGPANVGVLGGGTRGMSQHECAEKHGFYSQLPPVSVPQ